MFKDIDWQSYIKFPVALCFPCILFWLMVNHDHGIYFANLIVGSIYLVSTLGAIIIFNYLESGNFFTIVKKQ